MKFLRRLLENSAAFVKNNLYLKRLYPVIEATDEFFFGTSKTTRFAPHIVDAIDIKRYMTFVIIGLMPATIAGIYFYGLRILTVIVVSYTFGGLTEVLFSVGRRKPIYEGFLVTGLIFPLTLPPTVPLWMVAVGSVFGVFFGKEVFGGTGRNIFNPALAGRVFLSLAFPEYFASMWQKPFIGGYGGFVRYSADAITSATPLINFKSTQMLTDYPSLLFGATPGCIGETLRIAVIIGGLFLILTKISDWRIPLSYIASVFVFSLFMHNVFPDKVAPALFQILTGGILFGAFFMATDPVTSPFTFEGKWVYGVLLGLVTVLIRGFSGFVEGVMFAVLLMNAIAPLIDTIVVNVRFKDITVPKA